MTGRSAAQRGIGVFATSVAAVVLAAQYVSGSTSAAVDAAFIRFWAADSPAQARTVADELLSAGVEFEDAFARLKRGRPYSADVPRGVVPQTHRLEGIDYPYLLDVPITYTPDRAYQVRIQLHGGVSRPDPSPRTNGIGPLAGAEQIYILPSGWDAAEWWTDRQLANIRAILDRVKRTYNVDENRVVLSGVSDGGTGTYYVAMRDATPFASFLPLNGALPVLRSASLQIDGELFPNNLREKPFFIVNGGLDPLYPTALVEPYVTQMAKSGVTVRYLPQPEARHNTAWWPTVKDAFEMFVRDHPRNPFPNTVTWESDLTADTGRAHWVVIDTLAPDRARRLQLPDVNDVVMAVADFGARTEGARVISVAADSGAARLGLRAADVVLSINGETMPPGVDLNLALADYEPREPVTIVVSRENHPTELKGAFDPQGSSRVLHMFQHLDPSGRVDVVRSGNTVTATTRQVGSFTLLLSPDVFDFAQPVTVVVDGTTVFQGRVTRSVETLFKWASRDNDRTMLYAAEIKVNVPR